MGLELSGVFFLLLSWYLYTKIGSENVITACTEERRLGRHVDVGCSLEGHVFCPQWRRKRPFSCFQYILSLFLWHMAVSSDTQWSLPLVNLSTYHHPNYVGSFPWQVSQQLLPNLIHFQNRYQNRLF